MWTPDFAQTDGPRYLALASAIAEAIESGALKPGAQLPPQRELAEHLNVTVGTVGRAYNIVKSRQLVTSQVGRGTFVRDPEDESTLRNYLPERKPGTIDFACYSATATGLAETLATAMAEAQRNIGLLAMQRYTPAAGFISHRSAGAEWIARTGLAVPPERVLVCSGAQQALMVILTALTRAGEVVLTEELTYSGIKALGTLLERPLHGVRIDAEGLIPAALEQAIAETGARLLYLQPTCHNPTGAMMPESRRRAIAEIARRHGLWMIEDDAAIGGLTDRPAPLARFAPEHTIYVTGLSKCISPGLRVAYAASPPRLFEHLSRTLHALCLANSPLQAEVATAMIQEGSAALIAERNLVALAESHARIGRLLRGVPHSTHPAAFFVWIDLPEHWTAPDFAEAARQAGLSVVSGESFSTGDAPRNAIRISVNPTQPAEMVEEGLAALLQLMNERRAPMITV